MANPWEMAWSVEAERSDPKPAPGGAAPWDMQWGQGEVKPKSGPEPQGWLDSALEFGMDMGKRVLGSAIHGAASAPHGLEQGVKGAVRTAVTGGASVVMPSSVYQPGLDADEAVFGPESDKQKASRELAGERAASSVPPIPGAAWLETQGRKGRNALHASVSDASKRAVEGSQVTGNLLKGEIDFGTDPSVRGYVMQASDVFGSMAPSLVATLVTKRPVMGGMVGGAMAGSEGSTGAREFIEKKTHEELLAESPFYVRMLKGGAAPKEARQLTADRGAETAALLQGLVGGAGDHLTGKLITGQLDHLIGKVAGKSIVGRAAAGGALSSAEQGTQELSEGLAADVGMKSVVRSKEIGEDSAVNFVLGALGGGPTGAAQGGRSAFAERNSDKVRKNEQDATKIEAGNADSKSAEAGNQGKGQAPVGAAGTTGATPARPAAAPVAAPGIGTFDYAAYPAFRRVLESGGRADAKNPESSAYGADQFTRGTWLETVSRAKPPWAQGMTEAELLEQRANPERSADMAAVLDQSNAAALRKAGQPVNQFTLYAAHHFGAGKGIQWARAGGSTPMADILTPAQLAANKYLAGMTKDQVIANWTQRAAKAGVGVSGAPAQARTASLYTSQNEQHEPTDLESAAEDGPSEAETALATPRELTDLDRAARLDKEASDVRRRMDGLGTSDDAVKATERAALAQEVADLEAERDSIRQTWPDMVPGKPASFTTEAGARLDAHYALADASKLVTSHDESLRQNAAYPQVLQPRARDRAASEIQVSGIVGKLDPARLGLSADAANGAPIVGADGLVESGNARTIALKRVYQADGAKAQAYRTFLEQNAADFGLDPAQVAGMAQPVLVRVRDTEVDRAEFARQANASTVASMSPSEQARSDSSRIDVLDDLTPDDNGDFMGASNRDFVRRFMARLPATEQAGMVDSAGNLSTAGYARVRNAVLAKAYGNSPVLQRMTESLDDNTRNFSRALMMAAPEVAKMRAAMDAGARHDVDLTSDVVAAVEELSRLKDDGVSVQDALAQAGIFGDKYSPETRALMQFLAENARRPRRIADFLKAYYAALDQAGDPNQGSLLGDAEPPAKSDLMQAAQRRTQGENDATERSDGAQPAAPGRQEDQGAGRQGGEQQPAAPGRVEGDRGDGSAGAEVSASKNVAASAQLASAGVENDSKTKGAERQPGGSKSATQNVATSAYVESAGAQKGVKPADSAEKTAEAGAAEWSAFPAGSGSLGVPRAEMPQIKSGDRSAFLQFLEARGMPYGMAEVGPDTLKPTQAEYSPGKVNRFAETGDGMGRSLLVSADGYVLDGHHQWMAHRQLGEEVPVIRIDAPIRDLLAAAGEFPSAQRSEGAPQQKTQAPAMLSRVAAADQTQTPAFKRWSSDAPLVTSAVAENYEFKTGQKIVVEAFHGTARPDRIGVVFDPKRATSGPMVFFTSSPALASDYAKDKEDTSLADEDQQYTAWFKFKPKGARSAVPIDRAWALLTPEQRERVRELAPQVRLDDDGDGVVLDGDAEDGLGNYQWELQQTRTSWDRNGNPLKALAESWLSSGSLFGDERKFLDVLRLAGFPVKDVTADFPTDSFPGVFKTFISMKSPLVVSDMPAEVRDALERAAKSDRSRAKPGADMWDKRSHTLRDWWAKFSDADPSVATYAWTSIPDKVTDILKSYGFDGIVDWSGKGGGHQAPVYVPFASNQVKSVFNRGTFDPSKRSILLARGDAGGGTPVAALQTLAARLAKRLPGLPKVNVLASADKAPDSLRDYVRSQGAARGAYFDGELYVFADQVGSVAEAEHVLAVHEANHAGLDALLGERREAVLTALAEQNPELLAQARAFADRHGVDMATAIEEAIVDKTPAELAGLGGWRRVVHVVERALVTRFPALARQLRKWLNGRLSDQQKAWMEVADLMSEVRGRLQGRGGEKEFPAITTRAGLQLPREAIANRPGTPESVNGLADGVAMFSRTPGTKAAYDARIDALFAGGSANRVGVRVLDKSDLLGLLGYGGKPVVLQESKVIAGQDNHPNMTAKDWKKVPEWIDNPAAVFDSDTEPGSLVFVAPEPVRGSPAVMIVKPHPTAGGKALSVSLLVNAYDKEGGMPVARWMRDGLMKYADKKTFPAIFTLSVGRQLPDTALQNKPGTPKILTEKNLAGWRKANPPLLSRSAGGRGFDAANGDVVADFKNDNPLKAHADYKAAKGGDVDAAARLVRDLVKPVSLEQSKAFGPDAIFVPVHAQEASGKNAIPAMLAMAHAQAAGAAVGSEITQANKAFHTGAGAMERLVNRAEFEGPVEAGKTYVLVDDVTTMGSTLADLAAYIQRNGGHVAGSVVLVNAARGGKMQASPKVINQLEVRHGQAIREILGIDANQLTGPEADYLIGFKSADEIRARRAKAELERVARLRSKEILPGRAPDEVTPKPKLSRVAAAESPAKRQNVAQRAKDKLKQLLNQERIDGLIYGFQDKLIDLKRLRAHITSINGTVNDLNDAYLGEELYHGRVARRSAKFLDDEVKPLLAAMNREGISVEQLERYLHARHAPEANRVLAERNPSETMIAERLDAAQAEVRDLEAKVASAEKRGAATEAVKQALAQAKEQADVWRKAEPFRGTEAERLSLSGMSDAEAKAHMEGLSRRAATSLAELAPMVDAIQRQTTETLLDYGLQDQQTIAAWRDTYEHYVPLHRDEAHENAASHPIGQGFSVRGDASKRRVGSNQKVTHILGHILMQRESAITRGEKNHVAKQVYLMAAQNPAPDWWQVDAAARRRSVDPATGMVRTTVDPSYRTKDNALVARIAGREVAVVFNERNPQAIRLARALKNLDSSDLPWLLQQTAKVTRYFSAINTQYNPVFGIVNFTRDTGGVMLNLESAGLKGNRKQVLASLKSAYSAVWRERRGKSAKDAEWSQLWEQLQADGGTTGYRELFADAKERTKEIQKTIDRATGQNKAMAMARGVLGVLEDYNDAMENATRLAVYKAALDQGMTRVRAASVAKNITVNFNRKGAWSRHMGALYAFFNAAVQGTARMVQTLSGPNGRAIMAGGVALGIMNSLVGMWVMGGGGGEDDDEWARIPEFVKANSIVIPTSRTTYLAIPMPLGFNMFPNLGRIATEWVTNANDKGHGEHLAEMLLAVTDAFNPLGGGGNLGQMVMPTVIDPMWALGTNRDWKNQPIYQEDFNSLDPTPGHMRTRDSASAFSKAVAEGINSATGGTDYTPGKWSPTPDQLDFVLGQLTGGVGRELLKLQQTVAAPITGEELPMHKTLLLGRFAGSTKGASAGSGQFYENVRKLNTLENEEDGRLRNGGDLDAFQRENPTAELIGDGKSAYARVRDLRKDQRELRKDGATKHRDELKEIDAEIDAEMRQLNREVERVRRQGSAASQ